MRLNPPETPARVGRGLNPKSGWNPSSDELTALEEGVIGGKWHSLIENVYAPAYRRKASGYGKLHAEAAGVDS